MSPRRNAEPRRARVLVVDDAEGIRSYIANLLELRGYGVDTAEDGRSALALLEAGANPDVVILDVMMPGLGGLQTLQRIRATHPRLPVIMLSVVGKASTIVEAIRLGASDYLNKPFEEEELEVTLAKVLERRGLEEERRELLEETSAEAVFEGPALASIREVIAQIADTDVTVMIQGESGTGKEIVARAVHESSNRSAGPFVKVNCAALPGQLLESELFGFEKGAFTGAHARKAGKFELAHRGTIFLDEIGEMSPALQAKLLHVIQDQSFSRLGGNVEVSVDARVVTATHRNIEEMAARGEFREDLYFRLNVVGISVPPLRERREELRGLAEHFLARFSARYDRPPRRFSAELLGLLGRYSFPGNIRELENLVKRIVVLESEAPVLRELGDALREAGASGISFEGLLEEIEASAGELPLREVSRLAAQQVEREAISQVLLRTNWNRKQASRLLGVSYKTLLQKIRECGLEPQ